MTIATMIKSATAAALALALSSGSAAADFRGGGSLTEFSANCSGWSGSVPVRVRHAPSELHGFPTQVTMMTPTYSEHLAVWQPFAATPLSYDALGRGMGTFFGIHPLWPRVRPVQRRIVARIDPLGPETVENAREIVLRLRISNFSNQQGCGATLIAVLTRA